MYRHQSEGKINDIQGWGERPLHTTLGDQYWRKERKPTISSYTDIGSQISDQSIKSQSWMRRTKTRESAGFPLRKVDYNFLRRLLGVTMKGSGNNLQEQFASTELREAVLKLREQVKELNIHIKDENWQQSLRDLGDIDTLDQEFLRALYLLRNCHQRGFFAGENNLLNESGRSRSLVTDEMSSDSCSILSSDDMASSITSDSFRVSTVSTSSSSRETRKLSAGSSIMAGGHSPSVVKRRPHRPQFFLSLDNFRNSNGILQERTKNICGLQRKGSDSSDDLHNYERQNSLDSDTSYLNVTEEHCVTSRSNSLEKSSPVLLVDAELEKNGAGGPALSPTQCKPCFKLNREKLKPGSPTSELLKGIYNAESCTELQSAVDDIYSPVSTSLSRLKNFEQELKLLPVLQVKLAVLQEEKRQLMNMLKQQRLNKARVTSCSNGSSPIHSGRSSPSLIGSDGDSVKLANTVGPQLETEVMTSAVSPTFEKEQAIPDSGVSSDISEKVCIDMGTQMMNLTESSYQQTNRISLYEIATETERIMQASKGVGDASAEILFIDQIVQEKPSTADFFGQTDAVLTKHASVMQGPALADMRSCGVQIQPGTKSIGLGESSVELPTAEKATQHFQEVANKEVYAKPLLKDSSDSIGCSMFDLVDVCAGNHVDFADFSCGEDFAELQKIDKQLQVCAQLISQATLTDSLAVKDAYSECSILHLREKRTIGVGSDSICDSLKTPTKNKAVGSYISSGPNVLYCAVDDKLCNCEKPKLRSVGLGSSTVSDIVCDRCQNKILKTIGVGKDKIDDILCDRCMYVKMKSAAVGEDRIDDPLCVRCKRKGKCLSIGVGDELVVPAGSLVDAEVQTDIIHHKLETRERARTFSNSSEEDLCREISDILAHEVGERSVLCHHCGNKASFFEDDSRSKTFGNVVNQRGPQALFQKSVANEFERISRTEDCSLESRTKNRPPTPDEEEDEEDHHTKKKADVIEICKLLQDHFSGTKHLKQQQMVLFMASIESLWFKMIKKKRSKPAVVKGYIDLFVSRIPELLQTIVNLADPDGNTAIHYALTYKLYPVVNILLDTGVCNVNILNKAGYTPVMLAGLVGFDNKKDKYVIQRLLNMGDLNAKSVAAGQTALMLAVTRGNLNMVDLLMDAGADVNEVDDDGSTALMCACEIGNINIVKLILGNPDCDASKEDNEGSTALSIAMDSRRKDLALLIYGSMNFDARGRIKLSPSKQSLLGLGGRRSPSPVIGRT